MARGPNAPRRFHQLGHRGGHLVEPAGVDPHLVAAPVDLDPGAVELPLDRGLAQFRDRLADVIRAPREHRQHRPEELDREGTEPRRATGQCRVGHLGEIARHHQRAAHVGRRPVGRARHRFHQQPLERALAQLARDQPAEEALLLRRESQQQLAQQPLPPLRRAFAGRARDRIEDRMHLRELDRGRVGGAVRHRVAIGGPAEAELLLPHRAREIGRGDRDLIRRCLAEDRGEQRDLVAPPGGLGEPAGGLRQGGELHRRAVIGVARGMGRQS